MTFPAVHLSRNIIVAFACCIAATAQAAELSDARGTVAVFVKPDQLFATFQNVCIDSVDRKDATARALAVPQAVRAEQGDRPKSYRLYNTPDTMIGVYGSEKFTCFVVGKMQSDEDVAAFAAHLPTLKGKPVEVKKRYTGVSFATWQKDRIIYLFEDKPEQDIHTVFLSVQNRK